LWDDEKPVARGDANDYSISCETECIPGYSKSYKSIQSILKHSVRTDLEEPIVSEENAELGVLENV
jgi:hypothetical protein